MKLSRTFLSLFSLPLLCLAIHSDTFDAASFRRYHQRSQSKPRNIKYRLQDMYRGQDFLDSWRFFDETDPTHGMVDYLSQKDAIKRGLAYVQEDRTTVLAVDNSTRLDKPGNRASVRISSPKKYNQGLFMADFSAMPFGCSVWPAWWSVGPEWPKGGEIDVLEGVHNSINNQLTLHTSSGCSLDTEVKPQLSASSDIGNTNCASSGADNTGCAFIDNNPHSYGQGFNKNGGGLYVHLWDSEGIKAWFFSRTEIPQDILEGDPKPGFWGKPVAFWKNGENCDIGKHFYEHELVIDTTLCGDWAGATYQGTCPGTCADAVKDPQNFDEARWGIGYIAVYQSV